MINLKENYIQVKFTVQYNNNAENMNHSDRQTSFFVRLQTSHPIEVTGY